MRFQVILNRRVTEVWDSITSLPEFEGVTKAGVINILIMDYLKNRSPSASKPTTLKKGLAKTQDEVNAELSKILS